jgi:hypothetical protein
MHWSKQPSRRARWRPKERLKKRTLVLVSVVFVFLTACDREQTPVQVVRAFMTAVETFDVGTVESLVCLDQKARVRESLAAFQDIADPEVFDVSLDELVLQEQSNDGQVAVVYVRGKLIVFFLGQQEVQQVDEKHTLVKEKGHWLVCDP